MTGKDFARLVDRDKACLHCGEVEAIAPQHRINRGMGGVGKNSPLNKPSNLIVLCSTLNGLIESDDRWATVAKTQGWKLERWEDPLTVPVFDRNTGEWRVLNDDYGYSIVQHEGKS